MISRTIDALLFRILPRDLYLRRKGLRFGKGCRWIGINRNTFGSEPYLVTLGNHVTVGSGVKFITHDGGVWVFRDRFPSIDVFKPVIVGSNVFLGLNSILLPGAVIGDNTVIGAGSVVSGELPGNGVYAGVPAKKIRNLDEYEAAMVPQSTDTKGLTPAEKRKALTDRFSS